MNPLAAEPWIPLAPATQFFDQPAVIIRLATNVTLRRARLTQHPADPSFRNAIRPQATFGPSPRSDVVARGSPVWAGSLPQNLIVQRLVSHQAFQPRILFLQLLQLTGHLRIHPAVLRAPTIVCLLADPQLLADFGNFLTFIVMHILGLFLFLAGIVCAIRELTLSLTPLEEESGYLEIVTAHQLAKSEYGKTFRITKTA